MAMTFLKTDVGETVGVNVGKAEIILTCNGHLQKRIQTSGKCAFAK
jgi:hypothetical protein